MEKPTNQTKYRFGDLLVEVFPCFLYELSYWRVYPNRFDRYSCKYYISKKDLGVYNEVYCKKYKDFTLERDIILCGVPEEFIIEHNLKPYNKNERAYRNSGRQVH